jgi:hypothetical protein
VGRWAGGARWISADGGGCHNVSNCDLKAVDERQK